MHDTMYFDCVHTHSPLEILWNPLPHLASTSLYMYDDGALYMWWDKLPFVGQSVELGLNWNGEKSSCGCVTGTDVVWLMPFWITASTSISHWMNSMVFPILLYSPCPGDGLDPWRWTGGWGIHLWWTAPLSSWKCGCSDHSVSPGHLGLLQVSYRTFLPVSVSFLLL